MGICTLSRKQEALKRMNFLIMECIRHSLIPTYIIHRLDGADFRRIEYLIRAPDNKPHRLVGSRMGTRSSLLIPETSTAVRWYFSTQAKEAFPEFGDISGSMQCVLDQPGLKKKALRKYY